MSPRARRILTSGLVIGWVALAPACASGSRAPTTTTTPTTTLEQRADALARKACDEHQPYHADDPAATDIAEAAKLDSRWQRLFEAMTYQGPVAVTDIARGGGPEAVVTQECLKAKAP